MKNLIFLVAIIPIIISCGTDKNVNASFSHVRSLHKSAEGCPSASLYVVGGAPTRTLRFISSTSISAKKREGGHIINEICSGTFISATQLITAAHCVENADKISVVITKEEKNEYGQNLNHLATAIDVSFHPLYAKSRGSDGADVAIVTLSQGDDASSQWEKLSAENSSLCSGINWVGYGETKLGDGSFGIRSVGRNLIIEKSPSEIVGSDAATIKWISKDGSATLLRSSFGRGDSGSGIFNEKGEIIGVAASVFNYSLDDGSESYTLSTAADLLAPQTRAWILETISE
jgi:V8-like Glu-specific endopeptidase